MKNFVTKIFFCIITLMFLQGCSSELYPPPKKMRGNGFASTDHIFKTPESAEKYYEKINKGSTIEENIHSFIAVPFIILEEIYWATDSLVGDGDQGWQYPYDSEKTRSIQERNAPIPVEEKNWHIREDWDKWAEWKLTTK